MALSGDTKRPRKFGERVNILNWKAWLAGQARGNAQAMPVRRRSDDADTTIFGALVMLVDDEPLSNDVTQVHLEDAGFRRFVATSDPGEALGLIVDRKPDILLLDLMMPGVSGFDILGGMEDMDVLKDVPTIVLTSASDAATKMKALQLGVTEFLTKPVDPIELVLRVSNTLAAKAYWRGCWVPR